MARAYEKYMQGGAQPRSYEKYMGASGDTLDPASLGRPVQSSGTMQTPQRLSGVQRGDQFVPAVEEQGVSGIQRFLIQNLGAGNSDIVADYLRKAGKTVERDQGGRILVSTPDDPRPRVIDPQGFDPQDITDLAADIALMFATGGGSLLGGKMAAQKATGPLLSRMVKGVGKAAVGGPVRGGAAGFAVGETARQAGGAAADVGEVDPTAIGVGTGMTLAAGGVPYAASRWAGRAGSVPIETINATAAAPIFGRNSATALVQKPAKEAEYLLGKELLGSVAESKATSMARPEFGPLLREATKRNVKVDGIRVYDAILATIDETAVEASRKSANARMRQFAEDFLDLLDPNDLSINPTKLDRFLRKDARGRVKDLIGREGGSDYQNMMKVVQEKVKNELHGALDQSGVASPKGIVASDVQAAESTKIASRKRVAGEFFRQPKGATAQEPFSAKIRTLFEPGNEARLEALKNFDKQHDTQWVDRARKLAYKRDWNPDERTAAHGLDRVLNVIFIGARPVSKLSSVLTRPGQAAASAAFSEMMSRPNP